MLGWNEPVLAFAFISAALKSSAVLSAAGLIVLFLRRQSAAARHLVWTGAFIVLLVLPFLSVSMPALRVPVSSALVPSETAFQVDAANTADRSISESQPLSGSVRLLSSVRWRPDWRLALLALWGLGTLASFGQMLAALVAMRNIRRGARPVTIPNFSSLAGPLDLKYRVEVFESRQNSMPIAFGLFRQAIFVPAELPEWSEERRRLVILHELAHIRRRDAAMHILARFTLGVYWWNPLAWLAWREFVKERERAADDLVLNAGARPSEYANHLLEIASGMHSPAVLGSAAVAMARRSQLEGRLMAILESGRNRKPVCRMSAISGATVAILLAAPLAALQSQDRAPSSIPAELAMANQGIVLMKLADVEREKGKFKEARPLYTKAIPLLGNSPEAATALLHMGAMALTNKNTREAIHDFGRAQALDSSDAGRSEMWMAVAQEQEGFPAQADSSYQTALTKTDPNSALAATIMELYAEFLHRQGRESEAQPLRDQSAAIRKTLGVEAMSTFQNTTPNVYKIGGDVTTPILVSKIEPEYSQDARAAKYQGSVLVYAEIGADGSAHNMEVSRGLGLGLNEKAIQAISQWKFKPSTKDGQPVTVGAYIEVNFRLL